MLASSLRSSSTDVTSPTYTLRAAFARGFSTDPDRVFDAIWRRTPREIMNEKQAAVSCGPIFAATARISGRMGLMLSRLKTVIADVAEAEYPVHRSCSGLKIDT